MTYIPPLNGKRISIKADSNSAIETGVVTLASGTNITLGQAGSTITVAAAAAAETTGVVKMYAGSSAPTGYLLCDGSAVSRTTYATLFGVISTTYGAGDGSTTFNLPDLRARIPIGAGTSTLVMTFSSRSGNVITVTGVDNNSDNEIQTGTQVAFASTGSTITGLSNPGTYYIVRQTNTSFSLATSQANAIAGTVVTLSGNGSGTRTFTITVGAKTLGDTGGEERHSLVAGEMPSHTHIQDAHTHTQASHNHTQNAHTHTQDSHNHTQDPHSHQIIFVNSNGGSGYIPLGLAGTQFPSSTGSTTATNQATTATNQNTTATNIAATATNNNTTATNQNTGGSADHNNLPPFTVMNYIIKT